MAGWDRAPEYGGGEPPEWLIPVAAAAIIAIAFAIYRWFAG